MPYKEGSCLNEEYTKAVKEIYNLIKEAKDKFDSLPNCIKRMITTDMGINMEGHLNITQKAACSFVKEFGINVE